VSLKVVGQLCEGLGVSVAQVIEFKAVQAHKYTAAYNHTPPL